MLFSTPSVLPTRELDHRTISRVFLSVAAASISRRNGTRSDRHFVPISGPCETTRYASAHSLTVRRASGIAAAMQSRNKLWIAGETSGVTYFCGGYASRRLAHARNCASSSAVQVDTGPLRRTETGARGRCFVGQPRGFGFGLRCCFFKTVADSHVSSRRRFSRGRFRSRAPARFHCGTCAACAHSRAGIVSRSACTWL